MSRSFPTKEGHQHRIGASLSQVPRVRRKRERNGTVHIFLFHPLFDLFCCICFALFSKVWKSYQHLNTNQIKTIIVRLKNKRKKHKVNIKKKERAQLWTWLPLEYEKREKRKIMVFVSYSHGNVFSVSCFFFLSSCCEPPLVHRLSRRHENNTDTYDSCCILSLWSVNPLFFVFPWKKKRVMLYFSPFLAFLLYFQFSYIYRYNTWLRIVQNRYEMWRLL